jgi:phage recombination protein Bet
VGKGGEMEKEQSVIKYKSRDGQDITLSFELVRDFLIQGKKELVSQQELFFFMGICKSRGLNPFKKDAYLIKYSEDPAAVVTSIDFYRSRARAKKDCTGWKSGIAILTEGKKIEYREGNLLLDGETLIGGWFESKPTGWDEPLKHTVNLKPYIKKTKQGEITRFWSEDKQPMMIQKVAEAQGLRKLWPDEFQQVYYEGEILAEERSPDTEIAKLAIMEPQKKKPPEQDQPPQEHDELISDPQRKRFYAIAKGTGASEDQIKEWLYREYSIEHSKDIPKSLYDEICEKVKVDLAANAQ